MHFEHMCFVIIQTPKTLTVLEEYSASCSYGLVEFLDSQIFDGKLHRSTLVLQDAYVRYAVEAPSYYENTYQGHIADKYTCALRLLCAKIYGLLSGRSTYTS